MTDIYTKLVEYVESNKRMDEYAANNRPMTRFELLKDLSKLGIELNQTSIEAIERLYQDNFIEA